MSEQENEKLFKQGVAAIRAGDKARARELLTQVVQENQLHEEAWLWLSAVVESNEERITCLQNVLTINPRNERAIAGMQKLGAPLSESAQKYAQAREPAPEPEAPADKRPDWLKSMSPDFIAKPEAETETPKVEEGWRKKQAEKGTYVADAVYVYDKGEAPPRTINDLANAWLSALIFKIPGDYQDEVDFGSMGHILANVAASVILQILALALPIAIYLVTKQSPARLFQPFIQGSQDVSQAVGQLSAMRAIPAPLRPAVGMLFPAAGQGVRVPVLTAEMMASFASLLLAAAVASILATFVILLVESMVVSRVAESLRGKGNVFQTSLALSIAMVTVQIVTLPVMLLSTVLPVTVLLVLFWAVRLYEFLQNSAAVNAAHRMGILLSMGVVILSNIAIGAILGCGIPLLALIAGFLGR